ncbi:THO complex subunit 2, partial [Lasiodiplodia theobromae]
MPPPIKRKRSERGPYNSQDVGDGSGPRPSPHRPQSLNLAQQNQYAGNGGGRGGRGGGARRESRGGSSSGPGGPGGGNSSGGGARGGRGERDAGSPAMTTTTGGESNAQSPVSRASPASFSRSETNNNPSSPTLTRPPSAHAAPPPPPAAPRPATPQEHSRPAPPAPPPVPQQQAPAPKPPIKFVYQYITDEQKAAWRTSGRKAVLDAALQAQEKEDFLTLSIIFQEVIRAGLDDRIDPADAGRVVKEVLAEAGEAATENASMFLDTVAVSTSMDPVTRGLWDLLVATGISPMQMKEELDIPQLQELGMVRKTFERMGTRMATNQLYRQSNYNLLREESEGYAKLMTEYFTTSNNEEPTWNAAAAAFQRVKALIGAFDLDVGRALDVTLDVFANLMIRHYRFFVKFMRASSWWPEEKSYESLEWETLGIESLPRWAQPGASGYQHTEKDVVEIAELCEERDRKFWQRVREVGLEAFFELGGRRITKGEITLESGESVAERLEKIEKERGMRDGSKPEDMTEAVFNKEWMAVTKTLPPPGNRVAAQLLGFKLRFYASSARDPEDRFPENLVFLAALLIKIGFISLRDLYPHLYPADKDMAVVKEKLMKEKEERERKNRPGGGQMNALAMAGALVDDTIPAPTAATRLREAESSRASSAKPEDKAGTPKSDKPDEAMKEESLSEPTDQKIALLKSLLCIGAIPESLYMLGKFPWLTDVHPDLPEYLHRILHHSLHKVYNALRPMQGHDQVRLVKKAEVEKGGAEKGELKSTDPPPRRTLRWASVEKQGSHNDSQIVDYRFYWEDWANNVPVCQTVDDVFSLCSSFLNFSGVKIGQDPALLTKLARIGKWSLAKDDSEANFTRWIDLSKRLLVPALSLTKSNPGVVNEVFDLLKLFPTSTRYSIYAEWYTGQTSRLPDIKAAFDQSTAETKDVLKRISKTNTKQMARALAKVAYSSPGIVFKVALNQIESYDNLVHVIVECARYFTYLGYDVLTWSLMSSLGGKGRPRQQDDGMLTSRWLQSLSFFAGSVFKRYTVMNATPILQYVTYQLRNGNTTDLDVLEQIMTQMTGIPMEPTFTENQLQGMAGGDLIQAQILEQIQDFRNQPGFKGPAKRLLRALVEPGLAGQLLIAIAQERQLFPHSELLADAPLKVLGVNMDRLTRIFFQYLEALRSNLSVKEFDAAIPDVVSLMSEFGIDTNIAFAVCRHSLSQAVLDVDMIAAEEDKKQKEEAKTEEQGKPATNGDVDMDDAPEDGQEEMDAEKKEEVKEEAPIKEEAGEKEEAAVSAPTPVATPAAPTADEPWHPIIKDLMDRLKTALPDDFEDKMSLSFYTTFWQLSHNDMAVPTQQYEDEIKALQKKITAVISDRSDVSVAGIKKKDAKKKELSDLQDRLRAEMKVQVQTYSMVRARLQKEKLHWFATHKLAMSPALHDYIIQECFLPRLLLSPFDAQYVYRMLIYLHSAGTPGFRTMFLIDRILREKQLTSLIFICTPSEIDNLGRFLNLLLLELGKWHADSAVYERTAYGAKKDLPGFGRKFNEERVPEVFLTYEDFRRLLYKWHVSLNNALKACLSSGEYMHIRNAIILLKVITPSFPRINFMGKQQLECIMKLSKEDSRGDLKLAAASLIGDLKKTEPHWMLPQAFKLADPNAPQKPNSRATTEGASTPQPGQARLNASAAEFKPSQQSNGVTTNGMKDKDAEDGEIGDGKDKPDQITMSVAGGERDRASDSKASTPGPTPAQLSGRGPHSDSKPSTPIPSHGQGPPSRPDTGRGPPPNTAGGRQPHALPNRPEPQPPRNRMGDRQDRPPRHDGRGPPNHDYGRLERPGDMPRDFPDRTRDASSSRRPRSRSPAPAHMDRDRRDPQWQGPREVWEDDRGRPLPRDTRQGARGPPQWNEPPSRGRPFDSPNDSQRGRPPYDQQSQPGDGRNWQSGPMPPPSTGPYQHPERAGRFGERGPPGQLPDRPSGPGDRSGMNPERAALLDSDVGPRRPERFGSERDSRRDRGSRPHSPRRGDERPPNFPPRDDYRDERGPPSQDRLPPSYPSSRDRRDDPNSIPPTGPRSDRSSRGDYPGPGASRGGRELFEPSAPRPPPADPNHGRLNQDFMPSRSSDPSYGRLNAPDAPSGPRGRGGAGRGRNQPSSVPPSPISERGPPLGPNADRREHRDSFDHGPQTPSNEHGQDTSGIHPDRLRQIPAARNDMPAPSSAFPPPSGPRGSHRQQPSLSGSDFQSPNARNPPTGPASSSERRHEDKRFAGINNMLQQSNSSPGGGGSGGGGGGGGYRNDNTGGPSSSSDRGASIRGRAGGRPGSTNSPAASQPSTPIPPHLDAPPRGGGGDGRPDLLPRGPGGGADMQLPGGGDERDHRGGSSRRGERSERRSGRHRSTSPRESSSRRGGGDDSNKRGGGPSSSSMADLVGPPLPHQPPSSSRESRRSGRGGGGPSGGGDDREGGGGSSSGHHRDSRRSMRGGDGGGGGWGGAEHDVGGMPGAGSGPYGGGPPNGEGGGGGSGRSMRNNGPGDGSGGGGSGRSREPREMREPRESRGGGGGGGSEREPRESRDRKRNRGGGDVDGGGGGGHAGGGGGLDGSGGGGGGGSGGGKRPRRGRGGEERDGGG